MRNQRFVRAVVIVVVVGMILTMVVAAFSVLS
jgi:hypothetical protein